MRGFLRTAGAVIVLTVCSGGLADDAFVASKGALPAEIFDPVQGAVLLFLAAASIVAFFGLLMVALRGHRRLRDTLDALEKRIAGEEEGK